MTLRNIDRASAYGKLASYGGIIDHFSGDHAWRKSLAKSPVKSPVRSRAKSPMRRIAICAPPGPRRFHRALP